MFSSIWNYLISLYEYFFNNQKNKKPRSEGIVIISEKVNYIESVINSYEGLNRELFAMTRDLIEMNENINKKRKEIRTLESSVIGLQDDISGQEKLIDSIYDEKIKSAKNEMESYKKFLEENNLDNELLKKINYIINY